MIQVSTFQPKKLLHLHRKQSNRVSTNWTKTCILITTIKKVKTNLSFQQQRTIIDIKNDPNYIIAVADKKLGPVYIERKKYISLAFQNHLNNKSTYLRLDEECFMHLKNRTTEIFKGMLAQAISKGQLPNHEKIFLKRALKQFNRNAYMYLTFKIHKLAIINFKYKIPSYRDLSTRAIITSVNSLHANMSKWADYHLKKLLQFIPTYIQDSFDFKFKLSKLSYIPSTSLLFTADAIKMYDNIEPMHALEILSRLFHYFNTKGLLPTNFPTEFLLKTLGLIMTHNVFQFGPSY